MIGPRRSGIAKGVGNKPDYRKAFLAGAHQLIAMGHAAMDQASHAADDEETITGELVAAIEEVLDQPQPAWLRYYSVHEEPRVNQSGRTGKKRKRLDIRIDCSKDRPRSRLCFEAKRLGPKHPVDVYLGSEGLGCFLLGHYARDSEDAAMLGYVQSESPEAWASKLGSTLNSHRKKYNVRKNGEWRRCSMKKGPDHTYRSCHNRPTVRKPIAIYHSLLRFC